MAAASVAGTDPKAALSADGLGEARLLRYVGPGGGKMAMERADGQLHSDDVPDDEPEVSVTGGTPVSRPLAGAHEAPAPPPALVVSDVVKAFRHGIWPRRRRVEVLRGTSLEVGAGELVGLVGENGSGKSTLMQIIVGLLDRDAGTITRPKRIGYCPQVPMLWDKLTVVEHFELFAHAYDLDDQAGVRAAEELLAELDFARYRDYRVEELSGGTRQKLNLALPLMHEPELLLLDEPYSGFDWETYLKFWEMSERRRNEGMGILIVSHLLAERERLDRMYELCDGRICAC